MLKKNGSASSATAADLARVIKRWMNCELTQQRNVVVGDVAREGEGSGEERGVGFAVKQPEAVVLAHLGGGLPGRLHHGGVHHFSGERRRCWHCRKTEK